MSSKRTTLIGRHFDTVALDYDNGSMGSIGGVSRSTGVDSLSYGSIDSSKKYPGSALSAQLANERFIRKQYLEKRAQRLKERLKDRPYDRRALTEYADVLYEQKNYLIAQKIIKRALGCGDFSGSWYLRLGKCSFRRWLVYKAPYDLDGALDAYRIAMKDPEIQKNRVHYFEVASMQLRLHRHQATLDLLGTVMMLFQDDDSWISIAQYNISLILFLNRRYADALKLVRELNVSRLYISVNRGEDHIFYLPYQIDNIIIELEIAVIHDAMGKKKMARNLLYELWHQVDKYRANGNTLQFDFKMGTTSFKEWYCNYQNFVRLGDMYRASNNFVMAAEMYRMGVERLLDLASWNQLFEMSEEEWEEMELDDQDAVLDCVITRAECLSAYGSPTEAERCAWFVFSKRPNDVVLTGKAARCCRNKLPGNKQLIEAANTIERAILLVQSNARIRVARAEKKKLQYAYKAEFIVTSFLKMCLTRNRTAADRLANCPVMHINSLVRSFLEGRIKLMKTGRESVENWVELWYYSAVTIQTACTKWLTRIKYGRFFKGIRAFERIVRGQIARSRLRKFILKMQQFLDENPPPKSRQKMSRQENRRMSINYEVVSRICCGTTCISSEEYILGTTPLNAFASPLRQKTRSERKTKTTLPPHRKSIWDKVEWFGDLAKRSYSGDGIDPEHSCRLGTSHSRASVSSGPKSAGASAVNMSMSRPFTAEAIKEYAEAHPDEDVISFISFLSVKADVTKQWVPFGILPAREIERTVQCTVLVITSPSFSCQDSKRFCHVVAQSAKDSWSRMKSLFIYGTRMGPSGLKNIINLGVAHMKTLSIGQTNMTHHFGGYIGSQLIEAKVYDNLSTSSSLPQSVPMSVSLYKIFIENEPLFGDRGIQSLLKGLAHNTSVKILALRGCNITNRGASATAKYIGTSSSIEIINLGENLFSCEGYLSIIRSVATKGFRGRLHSVSLKDQTPGYASKAQLMELYDVGVNLGLKVVSDEITAREETTYELNKRKDTDQEDIAHMRKVFKDIVSDDRLEEDEILSTSYKKVIYL
mmetsp:Transcript_3827/g.5954  ORF Transcript_3827/g.5954 Transcript_3827/m.5954 type:complete len:1046 (+) Transcript_3827:145-3282(+)